MYHLRLWAKLDPFHPLWCHLLDTAAVCEALLPRFGGVESLPEEWVVLLVALHDLGKADPWFQNKNQEAAEELRRQGVELPPWTTDAAETYRKFRHEARSAAWVRRWLRHEPRAWGRHAAKVVAKAIEGHHGDFGTKACYPEHGEQVTAWDERRQALCELVFGALNPPTFSLERLEHASAAGAKLSGLLVLSDWIASNEEIYRYDRLPTDREAAGYLEAAREAAGRAVRQLGLDAQHEEADSAVPSFQELWAHLNLRAPRPLQAKFEELCREGLPPGLAIIEAPMGEGKSEAAIYLAECWNRAAGRRGAYLALPTQATANQMHGRYRDFLSSRHADTALPRLVHGMAWLLDEPTPVTAPETFAGDDNDQAQSLARDWFRPLRRALLASDGVGTVDQALLAALNVRFGFLRLLGLHAKTLIIDEVHAYDEFMTTLMERLLVWCRALDIGVILLSATLSLEQKRKLCLAYAGEGRADEVNGIVEAEDPASVPYPLLTFVPQTPPCRTVPVAADAAHAGTVERHLHPGLLTDPAGSAALATSLVREGGCACVLVNTVAAAQAVFAKLEARRQTDELADTELLLFHARFRAERRDEIERRVTGLFGKDAGAARPRRAILVATQVVEQSLDVDFDVMVSQIAPIDLLLQRSGRMWRHSRDWRGGHEHPVLHLLLPGDGALAFGPTEFVYQREVLLRTLSLLHEYPSFRLPDDFRPLIEGCYARGPLPNDLIPAEELKAAAAKRDQERAEHRNLAKTHLLPEPRPDVFELASRSAGETEGEGESHSYFVAQTRLPGPTRPVLVLHDPQLTALAQSDTEERPGSVLRRNAPPRTDQAAVLRQRVNLPGYWLKDAEPEEGFEPVLEGRTWLRGQLVLPMRNGAWRGRDSNGQLFEIRDDPHRGVERVLLNGDDQRKETLDDTADNGYAG